MIDLSRDLRANWPNKSKPAPVQSAEEFAKKLTHKGYDSRGARIDLYYEDILPLIESRDAAQRQAGREEAMRLERRGCPECEDGIFDQVIAGVGICNTCGGIARIKALSDMEEGRKG